MLPNFSEIDISSLNGLKFDVKDICTLELTVPTGLEEVGAQECKEKLNVTPLIFRGRVIFDIPIKNVPQCLKLRSVENITVLIGVQSSFQLTQEREKCFEKLYKLVNIPDWRKGVMVWQSVFGIEYEDPLKGERELSGKYCTPKPEVDLKLMKNDSIISSNLPQEVLSSIKARKEEEKNKIKSDHPTKNKESSDITNNDKQREGAIGPKFRVSCHRVGNNHKFGSAEAARQFGGGINDKFGWPVDLTRFDVEVFLNIIEDFVYVTLSLTKSPLFERNLAYFGRTNLRSTICYNMIRLAKPEPGDFIIDPMCGGGSIPIEGALTYPKCFHLGGDNFEAATNRSRMNMGHVEEKQGEGKCFPFDSIRWDATSLPLRDQVVDVVISDLPFGKRMGTRADNRVLYFKSLVELARVTKLETGRAVLLTYDKKSIGKSLLRVMPLWKSFSTRSINIGGLIASIYLLQRTSLFSDPSVMKENLEETKGRKRKLSNDKGECPQN